MTNRDYEDLIAGPCRELSRLDHEERAKQRGLAFVSLYAAAKQITHNFESRYPYLQYWVKYIEDNKLAPPIKQS